MGSQTSILIHAVAGNIHILFRLLQQRRQEEMNNVIKFTHSPEALKETFYSQLILMSRRHGYSTVRIYAKTMLSDEELFLNLPKDDLVQSLISLKESIGYTNLKKEILHNV